MALSFLRLKPFRDSMFIPWNRFDMLVSTSIANKGGAVSVPIGADASSPFLFEHNAAAVQSFDAVIQCSPVRVQTRAAKVGARSFCGIQTSTAVLDLIPITFPIPRVWDRRQPIDMRVWWSSEAAAVGTRSITWKVQYNTFTADDSIYGTLVDLDTLIAVDYPAGTSGYFQVSPTGRINAGKIAAAHTMLDLNVFMSAFDGAFTEKKFFLGLEIEYTPRWSGRGLQRMASEFSSGI